MPGLNALDLQGELVRRIHALEADLARVATVRREVQHGFKAEGADGQVVSAATATKIEFDITVYDHPAGAWDTDANTWGPTANGIYAFDLYVRLQAGAASQTGSLGLHSTVGLVWVGGTTHGTIAGDLGLRLSGFMPFFTTDTILAWVNLPSGGTLAAASSLTVQRLADLPENTTRS